MKPIPLLMTWCSLSIIGMVGMAGLIASLNLSEPVKALSLFGVGVAMLVNMRVFAKWFDSQDWE